MLIRIMNRTLTHNALCMVRMPIGYAIYTLLADEVNFKK